MESANVVGYQERAVEKSGWNLICNTFLPVNGDKAGMTLGDIKPNGWDFWSGDTIQFLDAGGGTASFTWTNPETQEEETLDALFTYATINEGAPADGWYQYDKAYNDMVYVPITETDFNSLSAGAAFVSQTSSDTTGIQFPAAL